MKHIFLFMQIFNPLLGKIVGCEKLSATKVSEHIPLAFSMSAISSFKAIENEIDVYRSKD